MNLIRLIRLIRFTPTYHSSLFTFHFVAGLRLPADATVHDWGIMAKPSQHRSSSADFPTLNPTRIYALSVCPIVGPYMLDFKLLKGLTVLKALIIKSSRKAAKRVEHNIGYHT